jgi:flagellin
MGLFVNTNVASLNGQRNLNKSTRMLFRSFQRLSSGLRINSAKDDAAGLSIASRFTAQARGLGVAARNTNDAISLAQTVEGALDEVTMIIQRMRELSVQSANDTNTNRDRGSIQAEIDQLIDEIDRIGSTTQFNNQNVLDGSFSGAKFHVGSNAHQNINLKTVDSRAKILGRQARYSGTTMIAEGLGDDDLSVNGITIRANVASDDQVSTSLNAGSAIAKAGAINDSFRYTGVRAIVNDTRASAFLNQISAITLDTVNNITINGELITGFRVQDDDADDSLINAINAVENITGVRAELDEALNLTLSAGDARNIEITVNGLATRLGFAAGNQVIAGSITIQSEDQIFLEQSQFAVARLGIGADPNGGSTLLGINSEYAVDTVDVSTREGANVALEILDVALNQVSSMRSDLGAFQNRLESTLNNLLVTSENVSAAKSRIMDADFAVETSILTKNQILQQASTSILAQANQAPNAALTLLQ